MIDQIGAPDGRNSRDPGARRVRIEALRASQRLVPGAVAPNDRDLSIMVVEEDEWCVSYTTLTDVTVGSVGDAFDNAMAESLNGSYKWELVKPRRWKTRSELELASVEWINWYNHTRLHGEIGDVPPAEYEAPWRADQEVPMLTGPKS